MSVPRASHTLSHTLSRFLAHNVPPAVEALLAHRKSALGASKWDGIVFRIAQSCSDEKNTVSWQLTHHLQRNRVVHDVFLVSCNGVCVLG
jgi:hypothetical protein